VHRRPVRGLHLFVQVTFDVQRELDSAVEQFGSVVEQQFGSAVIGGPCPAGTVEEDRAATGGSACRMEGHACFRGRCQ
jgi:hypothetical protein